MIKRDKLDECEKIYYLHSSLAQEPLRLIKHLPMAEDSYKNAWQILKKWYDNEKQIVYSLYDGFFKMSKMQSESGTELREMMTKLVESEYAFKSLKKDMDTLGPVMVYYAVQQLDPITAGHWEEAIKGCIEEPSLEDLTSFLRTRCMVLDQIGKSQVPSKEKQKNKSSFTPTTANSKNIHQSGYCQQQC